MMNDQQPAQASTKEDRLAFAAYLTAMLGDGEQLPNRTQLHKAPYLLEGIAKVQHGFPFALYLHGPYSYELDAALSELSAIVSPPSAPLRLSCTCARSVTPPGQK